MRGFSNSQKEKSLLRVTKIVIIMDYHKKTIDVIEASKYNNRQIAEILNISTKGAENKRKKSGSNQFLKNDFDKLKDHINSLKKIADK